MNAIERQKIAKSIGVSVSEMSKLVGQSDKLTLSGVAASSFEDLLGQEGISQIAQLKGQFSALAATMTNVRCSCVNVSSWYIIFHGNSNCKCGRRFGKDDCHDRLEAQWQLWFCKSGIE